MGISIRKAEEKDRQTLAELLIEAFRGQIPGLDEYASQIMPYLLENRILERFLVAEEGQVAGLIALSDGRERMVRVDKKELSRHYGLAVSLIAAPILRDEFEKELDLPEGGQFVEALAVSPDFQGKGVGRSLLRYAKAHGQLPLTLDVADTNPRAMKLYQEEGFVETRREKVKHAKYKGSSEKIYMVYKG